jgi:Uma2 family endonuclease
VIPASKEHHVIQNRVQRVLEACLGLYGVVLRSLPYRPGPEFKFRQADVGYVPKALWDTLPDDWSTCYAPEIIVEIRLNSKQLGKREKRKVLAMDAGCREFWIVDTEHQVIEVTTPKGLNVWSADWSGDGIPVGVCEVSPAAIFEEL